MEEESNHVPGNGVPMSFRVSSQEKVKIIQNARSKNITVSAYLRLAALGDFSIDEPMAVYESLFDSPNQTKEMPGLKNLPNSEPLVISCTPGQRQLLKKIYHPDAFVAETFAPKNTYGFDFENRLLVALFILPTLRRVDISDVDSIREDFFINETYDLPEYYALLKLENDKLGEAIFKIMSDVISSEESRITDVIAYHESLKKQLEKLGEIVNKANNAQTK